MYARTTNYKSFINVARCLLVIRSFRAVGYTPYCLDKEHKLRSCNWDFCFVNSRGFCGNILGLEMEYVFYYLVAGVVFAAAEAISFKGEDTVFNLSKTTKALYWVALWVPILVAVLFLCLAAFAQDLIKRK